MVKTVQVFWKDIESASLTYSSGSSGGGETTPQSGSGEDSTPEPASSEESTDAPSEETEAPSQPTEAPDSDEDDSAAAIFSSKFPLML